MRVEKSEPIRALLWSVTAAAIAAGSFPGAAQAFDYSGKRVEFVIPFSTGGGSDNWARFFAPRFQAALPGNPVIAVMNVPGGGSITGANQYAERAKPDGLSVLGTSGSTQFPFLLGDERVKYDYKDWTVILVTPTGGVVYARPDLGVRSAAEVGKLRGKPLIYGSQGVTSLDLVVPLAFEILGIDLKVVFGMKGRGPARLAFERGESNIDYQTTAAYVKSVQPLVDGGKAIPLWAWGSIDENGNLVRDPTFKDLPHFGEVYKIVHGKEPSGPAWNAWKAFFVAGFAAQKMIVLPKTTPKEILDTWRTAAEKVVREPGFEQAADQALGDVDQGLGKKAEALFKLATEVDAESKAWVRNWLTTKFDAKL